MSVLVACLPVATCCVVDLCSDNLSIHPNSAPSQNASPSQRRKSLPTAAAWTSHLDIPAVHMTVPPYQSPSTDTQQKTGKHPHNDNAHQLEQA